MVHPTIRQDGNRKYANDADCTGIDYGTKKVAAYRVSLDDGVEESTR